MVVMAFTTTLKISSLWACSIIERDSRRIDSPGVFPGRLHSDRSWVHELSSTKHYSNTLTRPWKADSRTVCLFGRKRRRAVEAERHVAEKDTSDYIEQQEVAKYEQPVASYYEKPDVVSVVAQPIWAPSNTRSAKQPFPAAVFLAALVFAGFGFALAKAFQSWRKGRIQQQLEATESEKEEEAVLKQARAKLAKAFGSSEYEGEVTTPQVASMMTSAANYLYALANEIADLRGELDDREERLAAALRRSQQDAEERKELIRRISMAEAELVEEQLKQAAHKSAAAQREREIQDKATAEVESLLTKHQEELQVLETQMQMKEREAEGAAAEIEKLHEEVQELKQSLKEKEGKLSEATKKANEDMEMQKTLRAHLEASKAELEAARSREDELKASLAETASGFEGAEQRLEQMQRRHEGEIQAVRGVASAQAKGLEERLKTAQEKTAELQAEMEAEAAARKEAEEQAEDLRNQIEQLEQDLIFLESKYKDAVMKRSAAPKLSKGTADIAAIREELESKTQQALAAKDLVLQLMENEREKEFELKQLRREASFAKERLEELEGQLEVSVASQIEGALNDPKGTPKGPTPGADSARERARYEQLLEEYKSDSEREISDLRRNLKSAREQLVRVQKQHSMEIETKLGKQEREFRMRLSEKENERDGCLVKVGSLEEELALEVQARQQAKLELSTAQEQLLEWEWRAVQMETAHVAALESEREASRQKLEALFLDYEKARDEALERESERVALLQRTEQLQAELTEAKSKRKLQEAKDNESETAVFALNQDIIEEAWVKQERFQAELEAQANQHATLVESLEEARASEFAASKEGQRKLEEEFALLRKEVQAMEAALRDAQIEKKRMLAQFSELERAHASATERVQKVDDQLASQEQDASLQAGLKARISELESSVRSKDDVITAEKARMAEKADIIDALKTEKAVTALEALEIFEENAVLKEKIQALLKEQEGALENFRAEAAAGDQELTRVRQRLAEVEGALACSQEELQKTKREEERLSEELAATREVTQRQGAYREQIEGLERALNASSSEAKRAVDIEANLRRSLQEESEKRDAALRELQEREETLRYLQQYFEERSSLEVQLMDLGRAHSRLRAARERPGSGNGRELSSLESEFSSLLERFESAVTTVAASYGDIDGMRKDGASQRSQGRAVKPSRPTNGSLAPKALELVGVDEVAGSSIFDLNGRLTSAERKAEQLQAELKQRVVRQMEWQADGYENPREGEDENSQGGATGKQTDQQAEIKERVSQMMETFKRRASSDGS